jgi:hypothetical protein
MKIEFDVPNFEKELEISIVIRKDGEVVYNQATPPASSTTAIEDKPKTSSRTTTKKNAGNFMDSNMF